MQTEVLNNGIVSLHKDTIDTLYGHSKNTLLFYILLLSGYYQDMAKSLLSITEEEYLDIQKYLLKKKLVKDTSGVKIKAKKTYMESLCESFENAKKTYNSTNTEKAKLIVYFYSKLTGKNITSDVTEIGVRKKLETSLFSMIIEAIWRNHHNGFCNGQGSQKWKWSMVSYLLRDETLKSQPMQRSLERTLDIPVSDENLELLESIIEIDSSVSYIQKIPFTYENIRNPKHQSEGDEILRKQREIKQNLGISIEDI